MGGKSFLGVPVSVSPNCLPKCASVRERWFIAVVMMVLFANIFAVGDASRVYHRDSNDDSLQLNVTIPANCSARYGPLRIFCISVSLYNVSSLILPNATEELIFNINHISKLPFLGHLSVPGISKIDFQGNEIIELPLLVFNLGFFF